MRKSREYVLLRGRDSIEMGYYNARDVRDNRTITLDSIRLLPVGINVILCW